MATGPRQIRDLLNHLSLGPKKSSRAHGVSKGTSSGLGAMGVVFSTWEKIAGEDLSRHAQPVKYSGGTLVVAVDQPVWAAQVRALSATLCKGVGEVSGTTPESLRVVVRG